MNFNKRRGFLLIILMITFLLIATACDTLLPFEVNDDIDESGATAVESNGEETSESRETEHTHNWKTASCNSPKTCSACGETVGSAAGHSWQAATCSTPKKCSKCGTTSGSAAGHSWQAATCSTPKKCSKCGTTSGSAAGHSWTAATCSSPKTCSKCGTTSGSAAGHSWQAATCSSPKTCSKCGTTSGSAAGHSWQAATCSSPKTCSECGTTSGSELGHSYSQGTCSRCGGKDSSYIETYTVGETWVVDDQWEFTVNSVSIHKLCNSYSNKSNGYTNEQVVIIEYTYKNIGYTSTTMDLFISSGDFDVYDGDGESARTYACTHELPSKECIVGTKCTASEAYILVNSSSNITLVVSNRTSNGNGTVKARFELSLSSNTESSHTHSWESATCTLSKTCSDCGTTSGTPLGHTWSGKTCSVCSATISMYSGTKAPDFGYALKTYVSPTSSTSTMYFYDNFTLNANDEPSDCFEIYDNLLSACGYILRDSFETDYGDTVLMYYNSSYNCVGVSVTTMPDMEGIMIYVT